MYRFRHTIYMIVIMSNHKTGTPNKDILPKKATTNIGLDSSVGEMPAR